MLPKIRELIVPRLRDHSKISGEFGPVERYGLLLFILGIGWTLAFTGWSIYLLLGYGEPGSEKWWWAPLIVAVWAFIVGRFRLWFYSGR